MMKSSTVPLILSLLLLASMCPTAGAEPLRVGAAAVVITPPAGVPLAGYYHVRGSEGVHDDLYSRVVVLEKDGVRAALVSLDLISTRREFVTKARELIEEQTGIPGRHVMISATHAHTGPILPSGVPGVGEREEPNEVALGYVQALPGLIARSVQEALDRLEPALVHAFVGREESLTFNRRFHLVDGSVGWNPGKLNPQVIKPAGPVDPSVPVVFFETAERKPLATYVNYAVHLDNVGGLQISADLPFTLSKALAGALGDGHVTLWTAGACGDLNHINVRWDRPQGGHGNAARMGTVLAGEVLRHWPDLRAAGEGALQVRSRVVPLPLAPIEEAGVDAALEKVRSANDGKPASFMELVHAHKVLDVYRRNGAPLEAEVQVITLGDDLAWVAMPGEVFVQLGLDLKLDSPFAQTMISSNANGSIGYIPNRRAYPQGAYEVVSARCAEGSGESLVAAVLELLKEIRSANRATGSK